MNTRHLSIIVVATALATGCSDSDHPYLIMAKPGPALESPPPAVAPMNVAGTWYSKTEVNAVNCGMGETVDAKTVVITQNSADIEMSMSSGDVFSGTVNGDIVEWAGSYTERGGTSDYTSTSVIFSADTGAGDAAWTWSNGTDSCNGTMAIDMAKDRVVSESLSNSWPAIADLVVFEDGVAFITGSLGAGGDEDDFFLVSLTEDSDLQVELSHFDTDNADLDLILIDADLTEVAMSVSTDQYEMVEASLTAGDYYIHVDPAAITGEQVYNLSIDLN